MKKLWLILLVCCVSAGCSAQPQSSEDTTTQPAVISVHSTKVDNRYNNQCAGSEVKLVQIGDKLYYNYKTNQLTYSDYTDETADFGTYEISSGGAHQLYEAGNKRSSVLLRLDFVYKNKILNDSIINDLDDEEYYNFKTKSYQPCDIVPEFQNREGNNSFTRFFVGDDIYCMTETALYQSLDEGKAKLCLDWDDVGLKYTPYPFYIQGKYFCYCTGEEDKRMFCRFDMEKKKLLNQIPYTATAPGVEPDATYGLTMDRLIVDGDVAYVVGDGHALLRFDLKDNSVETIVDPNSSLYMNVYDHTLYYGIMQEGDAGLYQVKGNGEPKQLYDKGVNSIYILDDTYVYFTDGEDNLYRIKNTGGEVEIVFKK